MLPASCIACKLAGINGARTCNACRTNILLADVEPTPAFELTWTCKSLAEWLGIVQAVVIATLPAGVHLVKFATEGCPNAYRLVRAE